MDARGVGRSLAPGGEVAGRSGYTIILMSNVLLHIEKSMISYVHRVERFLMVIHAGGIMMHMACWRRWS